MAAVCAAGPLPMMQSFVFSIFRGMISPSEEEVSPASDEEVEEAVDEGEEEEDEVNEEEDEEEEDTLELEAAIVAAAAVEASPKPMMLRALVKNVFGKIPITVLD